MRKVDRTWLPADRREVLLAALGVLLIASVAALLTTTRGLAHSNVSGIADVLPLIAFLALPAAALLSAGPSLGRLQPTPFVLATLVAVGLMMRLAWLGTTPPLDDDFYRYLWDGAMVAHGLDPYRHAPSEFLRGSGTPQEHWPLAESGQAVLAHINFNDMRSIYPSVAQAAFALAYLIAPFDIDGLRIVFLGGEAATLALLIALLRAGGASPMWSALYWWNPLAAAMTVGLCHLDALIPPLVLGALLASVRGRPYLALALLGLGAGVKVWPLMLAPIVLWPLLADPRRLVLAGLVFGATLAVAMGPVLWSAIRPGSGFAAYAGNWSNNNAFYAWAVVGLREGLGLGDAAERTLRLALAAATGIVALVQAVRGDGSPKSLAQRFMIVAAAVFYFSPVQFPWYAVWVLPLAALLRCWPLLLASALLPFYYLYFLHWPLEGGRFFFYGIAFIHAVPVLGWLLVEAVRKRAAGRGHDA
jgi:alpha-1,6-mannosyltransferase